MKKNLLFLAGAVVALVLNSCAYDPYYTSVGGSYSSGGGSYSSGYGDGYGYGGSNFSTSVFVSTGDPRWGYDPNCYSYYDYRSRRYYDPYLNGYYPVGYRPPIVYGVPHPHGWRPGRGYISPPGYVSGGYIRNYRNRESAYRGSRYGWASQVRQQPQTSHRPPSGRPQQGNSYSRPDSGRPTASRPQNSNPRDNPSRNQGSRPGQGSRPNQGRQDPRQGNRQQDSRPTRYNTPVNTGRQPAQRPQQQAQRPQQGGGRQQAQRAPQNQGSRPQGRQEAPRGNNKSREGDGDGRVRGSR